MTGPDKRSRRARRARQRRRQHQIRIGTGIALVVLVLAVGVLMATRSSGPQASIVDIDLVEYGFEGDLVAEAGPIRLSATNVGAVPHNIGIRGGPISSDLRPGASADLEVGDLAAGTYELYCDIGDHEQRGMVATLVVNPKAEPAP